jgi:predicted lipoprotein with Yx(FWY)xxD motif
MSVLDLGKVGWGVAGAAAVAALVAGCASSSSAPKPAAGGALETRSTGIGAVLVDASQHTVYELVGDSTAHPTCTGGCLAVWPAVKHNGHQVIVNGHPVYTYVGDTSAGQTKGQHLKDQWGLWLALDAKGNPISSRTSTTTKAPGGGGPVF